jgi:hypothetical protein
MKVPELHDKFKAEYDTLSDEEKEALVERFIQTKADVSKIRRDTPRARIREVSNTVCNI